MDSISWCRWIFIYSFIYSYGQILSLSKFTKCSSMLINWKYYGDNDNLFYDPRPLQERFTKPFYFKSKYNINQYLFSAGKTIVRSGLNLTWDHFPHYLKNKPICRPKGRILKNYLSRTQYYTAYIKHFATKSKEEFIKRVIIGIISSN